MRRKLFDFYQWHSWFAWHSVVVGSEAVWLECVERRCVSVNEAGTNWEYRLPDTLCVSSESGT